MNEMVLPWDDWQIEKEIGRGGYGVVYKISNAKTRKKEAVKVLSFPRDDSEIRKLLLENHSKEDIKSIYKASVDKVQEEYELMRSLKEQRNVVKCNAFKTVKHADGIGSDVFIRMELLTPLIEYLLNNEMDEAEIVKFGIDICTALVECQSKGIIHRDIKPENLFVSPRGIFKLGDFGIARVMDHTTYATMTGTYQYIAPEVFKSNKYGKEADIYSFGLVMYWLLNNCRGPFLPIDRPCTYEESERANRRRMGGEKIPAPINGSYQLKQIVLKACEYNSRKRFHTAKDMLKGLESLGVQRHVSKTGAGYSRKKNEPKEIVPYGNEKIEKTVKVPPPERVENNKDIVTSKGAGYSRKKKEPKEIVPYGNHKKEKMVRVPQSGRVDDIIRIVTSPIGENNSSVSVGSFAEEPNNKETEINNPTVSSGSRGLFYKILKFIGIMALVDGLLFLPAGFSDGAIQAILICSGIVLWSFGRNKMKEHGRASNNTSNEILENKQEKSDSLDIKDSKRKRESNNGSPRGRIGNEKQTTDEKYSREDQKKTYDQTAVEELNTSVHNRVLVKQNGVEIIGDGFEYDNKEESYHLKLIFSNKTYEKMNIVPCITSVNGCQVKSIMAVDLAGGEKKKDVLIIDQKELNQYKISNINTIKTEFQVRITVGTESKKFFRLVPITLKVPYSQKCFLQEQFGENCRIKWRILHLQNGESCKQSPDWDDQSGNCRHNINFIYAM